VTSIGFQEPGFVDELKARTSPALWNRVTMKKALTPTEVAAELEQATIVLFPTRVDNSPNSVKEAAVAGVPVVASAVGGIVDYIKSGLNGITFPAGDLNSFVAAIREAVAHPLFGKGQVDPKNLDQVRHYLSPELMAQRFLQVYRRVPQQRSALQ
jgi:glycosyltransferase involved in cell wall biosynthesis